MRDYHAARGTVGLEASEQPPVSFPLSLSDRADVRSYGVSRVYDQQCGYVLSDAQAAQLKLRELLKVARSHDLDTSAAKARFVCLRDLFELY